jgi:iron-sulfur cluster repair protein YtfE (RIC family)
MEIESLAAALEREHREIDEGIDAFVAGSPSDESGRQRLRQAISALRRHIYLEEEFLFPPLREAGLIAPIFVMLREHGQMWNTLDALEGELETGTPAVVARLCRQLMVQLQHHNPKEERVLYPQADHVLGAPASAELREFLDHGELPAGWVCAKAEARAER